MTYFHGPLNDPLVHMAAPLPSLRGLCDAQLTYCYGPDGERPRSEFICTECVRLSEEQKT